MLKEDGDVGALRMVNSHKELKDNDDWPSWVPDFSNPLEFGGTRGTE